MCLLRASATMFRDLPFVTALFVKVFHSFFIPTPRSAFLIALCLRKSFPRFVCCLQLLFCIFFVTRGELCLTIQSSYLPLPTMSQSAHFVFFFLTYRPAYSLVLPAVADDVATHPCCVFDIQPRPPHCPVHSFYPPSPTMLQLLLTFFLSSS